VSTRAYVRIIQVAALVGLFAAAGCAGVKQVATNGTGGSSSKGGSFGSGGVSTGSGGSIITPSGCNGPCTDFEPTASSPNPIFQVNVDPGVTGMFGTPSGSGPCVTEPEDGSLFPNNWLAPRVHVPGNVGYLKITFHADMESTDLVAYAQGDSWALPKPIWQNLASHITEQNVTVTVQTPNGGATSVNFQIAPVGAGGSMVFWSADPKAVGKTGVESMAQSALVNDSFLDGFTVGDDSTLWQASGGKTPALSITDVKQQVPTQNGTTQGSHCIGCHVGTPDGNYVAFVDAWPWGAAFAGIQASGKGQALPTYPGASCTNWNTCTGSRTFFQYPWMGGMTFSQAHWSTGDQIAIVAAQIPASDLTMPWTTDDYQPGNLVWVDTESSAVTMNNGQPFPTRGAAFDYMQHTGDLGGVAFPTWSNDGTTIVYSSTPGGCSGQGCTPGDQDGRLNVGHTDLYSVQYNNRAGGSATAVPGGSSSSLEEYYPAFAPDDSMLAFTAVQAGQVMYANKIAELYMTPFATPSGLADAKPIRLNANDPPACTGLSSPGINNHWPKWSPTVGIANNKTYYWLIFSSNRYNPTPITATNGSSPTTVYVSQLYITAVVKNEVGYSTYPAIYLYNQPANRLNTTPAWQDFNIPIVIDKP
jgi:hypothetical protein